MKKKGIKTILIIFSFLILLVKNYGLIDLHIVKNIKIFSMTNKNKKVKSIKKKKKKIVVGIEKNYNNTLYGKLGKKIITNFLKNEYKIKFKIIKEKDISTYLKSGNIQILLSDLDYREVKNQKIYFSNYLFREAIYLLMNDENYKKFIYPDSLFSETVGFLYNSESYKQINKIFIRNKKDINKYNNLHYFRNINNLLEYYILSKFSIILLTRKEYYAKYYSLPAIQLFFIEFGKPFGRMLFLNKSIKNEFNLYIQHNVGIEHSWEVLFLKNKIKK